MHEVEAATGYASKIHRDVAAVVHKVVQGIPVRKIKPSTLPGLERAIADQPQLLDGVHETCAKVGSWLTQNTNGVELLESLDLRDFNRHYANKSLKFLVFLKERAVRSSLDLVAVGGQWNLMFAMGNPSHETCSSRGYAPKFIFRAHAMCDFQFVRNGERRILCAKEDSRSIMTEVKNMDIIVFQRHLDVFETFSGVLMPFLGGQLYHRCGAHKKPLIRVKMNSEEKLSCSTKGCKNLVSWQCPVGVGHFSCRVGLCSKCIKQKNKPDEEFELVFPGKNRSTCKPSCCTVQATIATDPSVPFDSVPTIDTAALRNLAENYDDGDERTFRLLDRLSDFTDSWQDAGSWNVRSEPLNDPIVYLQPRSDRGLSSTFLYNR
jgi:hypothetical protein